MLRNVMDSVDNWVPPLQLPLAYVTKPRALVTYEGDHVSIPQNTMATWLERNRGKYAVGTSITDQSMVLLSWPQYSNKCFRLDTGQRELEGNITAGRKKEALSAVMSIKHGTHSALSPYRNEEKDNFQILKIPIRTYIFINYTNSAKARDVYQ
jgi:hypothetical protein